MSKDEFEVKARDGSNWMLTSQWIRHTQNPVAPKYPRVGEVIRLKENYSFFLKADTPYTVSQVEEWEPANSPDEDGRDIRLSFLECPHKALNGCAIRRLIGAPVIDLAATDKDTSNE